MPKNLPSLKARQLIRLLESAGCKFYREGKGDHKLYVRYTEGKKRVCIFDISQNFFQKKIKKVQLRRKSQNSFSHCALLKSGTTRSLTHSS